MAKKHSAGKDAPKSSRPYVFLGDSHTDGFTWPMLMRQALAATGQTPPPFVNAAGGGDTALINLERMDDYVLRYKPAMSFILVGGNDLARGRTVEQFESDLKQIILGLRKAGSKIVMISGPMGGPKKETPEHAKSYRRYEDVKVRLARRYGCIFADARAYTRQAWALGLWLWESDHVHLNVDGYRLVVRSVLDALGYKDVPPTEDFKVELMPGVVTPWKLTHAPAAPLDEKSVKKVRPDATWKVLDLPEARPQASWWPDQVRRQGMVLSVAELVGPAETYLGVAEVRSPRAVRKYLNTGGGLKSVWLNGECVFRFKKWTGFHPGKERIAVRLQAGRNRIVIETGGQFSLNLTDSLLW